MKFTCRRSDLLDAVNIVERAVAAKSTMNILEGIYIEAKADAIRFLGNNLELCIDCIIPGEVTEKVSYDDLSGTVHVGDKVGSVTLKQDGTKIAVMDLVADEEGAGPNPIEWLLVKLDRLGRRIDNRPLTAESETVAKAPEV